MKLTQELETLVSKRVATWDPEGDNMPELLMMMDGKLTVVVVAGIGNGFADLGSALTPLAEKLVGRVTEYALILTARLRDPETGKAGEWVVTVLRGNADGQKYTVDGEVADVSGRVPEALTTLVAA